MYVISLRKAEVSPNSHSVHLKIQCVSEPRCMTNALSTIYLIASPTDISGQDCVCSVGQVSLFVMDSIYTILVRYWIQFLCYNNYCLLVHSIRV